MQDATRWFHGSRWSSAGIGLLLTGLLAPAVAAHGSDVPTASAMARSGAAVSSEVPAAAQRGEAQGLTDRAANRMQEERLPAALELLDRALQEDSRHWEAHYQWGRALALMGAFEPALDALLQAVDLNPGHGHTHRLAALAALRLEDWQIAWSQAINAALAGEDMNQVFFQLYEASEVPPDFETRIQAARIFVGRPDAAEIAARAELPYNRNPEAAVGPGRGGVGTISGRPADVMGRERLQERIADIDRMQRLLRDLLVEHPAFGVVLEPEQADLILGISIDELGERPPVRMEGYLRLYDTVSGEAVYYREVDFRDITQEAIMHGELTRYLEDLGDWIEEWRSGNR